ncbi:MAG: hypothetical protein Q8O03_02780 [Nanoarchaeota archaeon]|nr:hypothetical protein [Nanoarchaeota archaeon]
MEDSKKPSLDQVIKKLEGLDIREWTRRNNDYGPWFLAKIGPLKICVYKLDKCHRISIESQNEVMCVKYYNTKKDSIEEKKISEFYTKVCKEHGEYSKKEFEEAIEQIFSD